MDVAEKKKKRNAMTKIDIKYVMLDDGIPMLFILGNHKDMSAHGKITSAGFVRFKNGKAETYGYSHSLRDCPEINKPESGDAEILTRFFGGE